MKSASAAPEKTASASLVPWDGALKKAYRHHLGASAAQEVKYPTMAQVAIEDIGDLRLQLNDNIFETVGQRGVTLSTEVIRIAYKEFAANMGQDIIFSKIAQAIHCTAFFLVTEAGADGLQMSANSWKGKLGLLNRWKAQHPTEPPLSRIEISRILVSTYGWKNNSGDLALIPEAQGSASSSGGNIKKAPAAKLSSSSSSSSSDGSASASGGNIKKASGAKLSSSSSSSTGDLSHPTLSHTPPRPTLSAKGRPAATRFPAVTQPAFSRSPARPSSATAKSPAGTTQKRPLNSSSQSLSMSQSRSHLKKKAKTPAVVGGASGASATEGGGDEGVVMEEGGGGGGDAVEMDEGDDGGDERGEGGGMEEQQDEEERSEQDEDEERDQENEQQDDDENEDDDIFGSDDNKSQASDEPPKAVDDKTEFENSMIELFEAYNMSQESNELITAAQNVRDLDPARKCTVEDTLANDKIVRAHLQLDPWLGRFLGEFAAANRRSRQQQISVLREAFDLPYGAKSNIAAQNEYILSHA